MRRHSAGFTWIELVLVLADVLPKSALLAFYASSIAASLERMERLAAELEKAGSIAAKTGDLLKDVGATLHTEHLVVGRAAVSDKPEILWDLPALEGLYLRLEDEFELQERNAALEQKLGLVTRTAQTLLDILDTRHSLRVEWYIVRSDGRLRHTTTQLLERTPRLPLLHEHHASLA